MPTTRNRPAAPADINLDVRRTEGLLNTSALQRAIFNSTNFSSIATGAERVIQIFNDGAERMLGYTATEVMNRITPADISDPQEVLARAKALSLEHRQADALSGMFRNHRGAAGGRAAARQASQARR